MDRFESKVVLITGAASGIGRAAAQRIAKEKGRVFCVDVNAEPLSEVVSEVDELGGEGASQTCDVSKVDDCRATIAACVERFGRIDSLVNMAGIIRMGHTDTFPVETWHQVIDINLTGTFYMCQAALPRLLETKGNIVNAASSICFRATPYAAAYAASKGGILTMSRMLAVEYGKRGLRVNSVAPGSIKTPMAAPPGLPEDADYDIIMRSMSLTKPEGPDVIAAAIAYLASDDAHHVNGEHILVDGATVA